MSINISQLLFIVLLVLSSTCQAKSWIKHSIENITVNNNQLQILITKTQVNDVSSLLSHSATYDNDPTRLYLLSYELSGEMNLAMNLASKSKFLVTTLKDTSILSTFSTNTTLVNGPDVRGPITFNNYNATGITTSREWPPFYPDVAEVSPAFTFLIPSKDAMHFLHGNSIFYTDSQKVYKDLSDEKEFFEFLEQPPKAKISDFRLTNDLNYIAKIRGYVGPHGPDALEVASLYDLQNKKHIKVSLPFQKFDRYADVLDMVSKGTELVFLVKFTAKKYPNKKVNINADHNIEYIERYQIISHPSGDIIDLKIDSNAMMYNSGKDYYWDASRDSLYIFDIRDSRPLQSIQVDKINTKSGSSSRFTLAVPELKYTSP